MHISHLKYGEGKCFEIMLWEIQQNIKLLELSVQKRDIKTAFLK